MLCKKRLGKIYKIGNGAVISVCPERSKLKAIGSFLTTFSGCSLIFFDMTESSSVGVVLGICTVRDNKNLYILIQTGTRPKTVPLIAVDLIKCFFEGNATALQLHMDKRQAVYQNGHIVAGIMFPTAFFVLVNHLQTIIVDILLINQGDIHGSAVLTGEILHMILLNLTGLFHDSVVVIGNFMLEKAIPFFVGKAILIEPLQLPAEIVDQSIFAVNGHVFVTLFHQHFNESMFQCRFTLVRIGAFCLWLVFCHNCAFIAR